VKYSDADNNPPALIQLWIDENHDGAYGATEKYAMTVDGAGADYIAGKYYTKSLTLACQGGCSYNYRFYATDGTNEATSSTPVSNSTVSVTNNIPYLGWTGESNYIIDGVDPDSGTGGITSFTFHRLLRSGQHLSGYNPGMG
jgi:hypothetical protein